MRLLHSDAAYRGAIDYRVPDQGRRQEWPACAPILCHTSALETYADTVPQPVIGWEKAPLRTIVALLLHRVREAAGRLVLIQIGTESYRKDEIYIGRTCHASQPASGRSVIMRA